MPSSVGSILINIIAAPGQALISLRDSPGSVWLPLLLLIGGWIGIWYWYFYAVDYAWLVQHMIATETAKAPDQAEQIRQGISQLQPGAMIILLSLFVILMLLLVTVLTSVYLVVVSAVVDDRYRFKHWFALAVWANVPSVFAMLAMVFNFALSPDARVPPEALNPLSFRSLFGLDISHRLSTVLDSIDLTSLWTWALLAYGYHLWTNRGWAASIAIVLAPIICLYGVWALWAWL